MLSNIVGLAFVFWSFFNFYNQSKGNNELIERCKVNEAHHLTLRTVGTIWAFTFFGSWFIDALKPVESVLFLALGVGSIVWLVKNGVRLYKERKVKNKGE